MKLNNKKHSSKKNPSYKSTMHFLASRVFFSTLLCIFLTSTPAHSGLFDWLFGKSGTKQEEALQENVQIETTPENDTSWTDEKVEYLTRYTKLRDWVAPDFQNQTQALGYDEKTFETPENLKAQVNFWLAIYTKYSTTQGVLHDPTNLEKVYAVIDFKDINSDESQDRYQKERARKKHIEDKKNEIAEKESIDVSKIRFQLGQSDRTKEALFFSGRYRAEMEAIFEEAGLPKELVRMVYVESSFNVLARSKVGASGLWQIMPRTSRPYRMLKSSVDLRNSPLDATKVSAKILRMNYNILGKWPLAITAYNHGANGIKRLTERYETTSLPELIEKVSSSPNFGFASRNFYACFLAMLEVEKNALKYFPTLRWSEPFESETVKLTEPLRYRDLLKLFDEDEEKLQVFNPHLLASTKKAFGVIESGVSVLLPKGKSIEKLLGPQLKKK
ncbi:MAG: lytic transglycosylase domain-containing protein [Pseudobdellovibrionaceae bacterium]